MVHLSLLDWIVHVLQSLAVLLGSSFDVYVRRNEGLT